MKFLNCFLLLSVLLVTGCGPTSNSKEEVPVYGSIPIVATLPAVADLVKQVGGVRVRVTTLTPEGVEPARFQPSEENVKALSNVRVLFHAGGSYEKAWLQAAEKIPTLTIALIGESVKPEQRLRNPNTGDEVEPAFWGDASLWALCIEDVLKALSEADPASRTVFEQNAAFYREKLVAIHDWAIRRAQETSPTRRVLVVPTQTFSYFAKAYGFEVVAATDEASARQALNVLSEKNIPTVFPMIEYSSENFSTLFGDSNIRLARPLYGYGPARKQNLVTVRGEVYDTASYTGMLKHNLNEIVDGLR